MRYTVDALREDVEALNRTLERLRLDQRLSVGHMAGHTTIELDIGVLAIGVLAFGEPKDCLFAGYGYVAGQLNGAQP